MSSNNHSFIGQMKPKTLIEIVLLSFVFISCEKKMTFDTRVFLSSEEVALHLDETSEFIILIPDIQNYVSFKENNPYLKKMLNCILALDDYGFKIKAVIQVGDVTNYNSVTEWSDAQDMFSVLDNKIPYIMCTGNHDYGENGDCTTRNTHFSEFFNYKNDSSLVAQFEKTRFENTVFRIDIFNKPIYIFALEFGPRDKVISWADSIAKANPDAMGMLLTHAYLYKDKQRYDFSTFKYEQSVSPYAYAFSSFEKVNDGEEIWNKLIYPNDLFKFVFCGHKTQPDYKGTLISNNSNSKKCLQLMFDTQDLERGGDGWFQILEFKNDQKSLEVENYSVITSTWESDTFSDLEEENKFIYR